MSVPFTGSLVLFAVLLWPLLVALVPLVPRWRAGALWVLPLAPLPALILALADGIATVTGAGTTAATSATSAPGTATLDGAQGAGVVHDLLLPNLVLGVELVPVPHAGLWLGMTAMVWAVAGWHAALTMKQGAQAGIFAGFWCLTLAGNLGVYLAGDVMTFYLAFAAVSLAAWFLVVHDRSRAALRAGRVYIALAITGEAALLTGLMIGAAGSEDLRIASVRDALGTDPLGPLALGLMIVAFGIKAGMLPLHIWLPVAHPAAPVPGSAVLSGAMVKAGLIGMLLFIPAASDWNTVLIGLGFAGAFGAALWGLTSRNPKAVLAYSTISQMGLLLVFVGAGSRGAGSEGVAFYALHHGLAKGALFLSVGLMMLAATAAQRRVVLGAAALMALSVAGLPLTGGALAKLAGKNALADGLADGLALAVTLSGITTTLVLGWFMLRLAEVRAKPGPAVRWPALLAGVGLLAALALALPWALWDSAVPLPGDYPLRRANIIDALWPVLAGLALLALLRRLPLPDLPPGDALHLLPGRAGMAAALTALQSGVRQGLMPKIPWPHKRAALRALLRCKRAEERLSRWPAIGPMLMGAALGLAALIALAP
ncbi:complex I subunit 5 family protein [Roseicitreum antarcticum]|uniref:Formate hydrogenlyase subunit 3/Multisubunit Na+/H+ antiporter, MnhD subunit n=1 Tax=Roseicitreum antarcticum TaxID=564137 RepID=A0A1H3D6C6_9RHOB|nr:complex I subunit 5 family protein [Roseicitreum antarcticum]SDX61927.1 Formate hydrogenlyase subunit 3/Multisubunit Na+/H+ antiporter, MnhD subunit [Roseicitreum antarcticum]